MALMIWFIIFVILTILNMFVAWQISEQFEALMRKIFLSYIFVSIITVAVIIIKEII